MKKIFYSLFFIIILFEQLSALTRGDVQIIEARENIQYLGQKITTDYFLLYKRPNDLRLQNKFKENIVELEKNIQKIADTTQNAITLNVLSFYRYRLDYIKDIAQESPKLSNATKLLEASEYFLEGARSIEYQHRYKSTKEEEMLEHCKELKYLIESVSKYYMAFQIGLRQEQYDKNRLEAIAEIDKQLNRLTHYHYPQNLKSKLTQIKHIWQHNQSFFRYIEKTTYPNLLLSSNALIKELLSDLEHHHKQNL
ncbi:MAG TPA: hypothetical protein ENK82_01795 [Campylobacterales bacterium]|nr:hypothetical protein [Campylobacterales bacterium]HHS92055.1 hypothetical protein [Campylobacterales bacterium]